MGTMKIYEDFIAELLQHNLITDFSSKTKTVRDYYTGNFKSNTKPKNFSIFCHKLWENWYVTDIKRKTIYFDEQWVTYISHRQKASSPVVQESSTKNTGIEDKLCNSQSCQLCLSKFSSETGYNDHCKSTKHKLRVLYLENKNNFDELDGLHFQFLDNNTSGFDNTNLLKLQFERNSRISKILKVTNRTAYCLEILEIFQVNPHQIGLNVQAKLNREKSINCGGSFNIVIKGSFMNSTSFILPIVMVCKSTYQDSLKYILKEIAVDVTSEFSSLKSGVPYSKPPKVKHAPTNEIVISGKIPEVYVSYYREEYPLKAFNIPRNLQEKLRNLVEMYPIFIERYRHDDSISKKFSAILGLNPIIEEDNYFNLLDNLINIEENQIKIDVRDYDTVSTLKLVGGNTYELEVPGLAEARPSLIIYDSVYVKRNREDVQKFQGIVSHVLENSVKLSFSKKFKRIYQRNKQFNVEFGYNRRPLKVQKQAISLAREHKIASYLFPKEDKLEIKRCIGGMSFFNSDLNNEQRRAVANILREKNAPYLIFGPPGTGKTVTVVESVLQVWKNIKDSRILVCAPSNSAANEIAVRLAKILHPKDMYRLVGNIYAQDSKLHEIENYANINEDGCFYMPSMQELLNRRVVLTTLVTAGRLVNGGTPDGHFSHVFIDEGGYATESESLIPIAGILSTKTNRGKVAGQIVLAGDPRQLGPVIHSNFVKYCGHDKSMLERLIDTCKVYARDESRTTPYNEAFVTKLLKNYRSHREILKIPNKLFYHNELIPVGNASSNLFTNWEHLMTPGFPVVFHHIVGEDGREYNSPSFFNIQEIEEVVAYIKKLVGARVRDTKITEDDIGIITPYRKQAQMLRKACKREGWNNLSVGSVEQFQGGEKLVIIISTVRSKNINQFQEIDKKCQLGFVSNAKRFNVAVTRAIALLIVIGNGDVLKTDDNWFDFIEYCMNNNSVTGTPFCLSDQEYLYETD